MIISNGNDILIFIRGDVTIVIITIICDSIDINAAGIGCISILSAMLRMSVCRAEVH